VREADDLPPL